MDIFLALILINFLVWRLRCMKIWLFICFTHENKKKYPQKYTLALLKKFYLSKKA